MYIFKVVILFHSVLVHTNGMPEGKKHIWYPKTGTSSRGGSPTDASEDKDSLRNQTATLVPETSMMRIDELSREYRPFEPFSNLTNPMDRDKKLPISQEIPISTTTTTTTTYQSFRAPPGFERNPRGTSIRYPKAETPSKEGSPTTDPALVTVSTTIPKPTEDKLDRQMRDNLRTQIPETGMKIDEPFREYKPFGPNPKLTEPMDGEKKLSSPQEIPMKTTYQSFDLPSGFRRISSDTSMQKLAHTTQQTQPSLERNVLSRFTNEQGQPPVTDQVLQHSGHKFSIPRNQNQQLAGTSEFRGKPESYAPRSPILPQESFQEKYAQRLKALEESRKRYQEIFEAMSLEPAASSQQRQQLAKDDIPEASLNTYDQFQRNLPTSLKPPFSEPIPQSISTLHHQTQPSIHKKENPERFLESSQQASILTTTQPRVYNESMYSRSGVGTSTDRPSILPQQSQHPWERKVDISTHIGALPTNVEHLKRNIFNPSDLSSTRQPNPQNVGADTMRSNTDRFQLLQRGYIEPIHSLEGKIRDDIAAIDKKTTQFDSIGINRPIIHSYNPSESVPPITGGKDSFYSLFPTAFTSQPRTQQQFEERKSNIFQAGGRLDQPTIPEQFEVPTSSATLQHRRRPTGRELNISVSTREPQQSAIKQSTITSDTREFRPAHYKGTSGLEFDREMPSGTEFESARTDRFITYPRKQVEPTTSMHKGKDPDYSTRGFSLFELTHDEIIDQSKKQSQPTVSTKNTFEGPTYSLFPNLEKTAASIPQSVFTGQQIHQSSERGGNKNLAEAKVIRETVKQDPVISRKKFHTTIPSGSEFSLFSSTRLDELHSQKLQPVKSVPEGDGGLEYVLFGPRDTVPSTMSRDTHASDSTSRQDLKSEEKKRGEDLKSEEKKRGEEIAKILLRRQTASAQGTVQPKLDTNILHPMVESEQQLHFGKLTPFDFAEDNLSRSPRRFDELILPQSSSSKPSGKQVIAEPREELRAEKRSQTIPTQKKSTPPVTSPEKSTQIKPPSFQTGDRRKSSPENKTIASRPIDEVSWPSLKLLNTRTDAFETEAENPRQTRVERIQSQSPLASPSSASSSPPTFKEKLYQKSLLERSINKPMRSVHDATVDERAWPALTASKSSGSKGISVSKLDFSQRSSTAPSSPAGSPSSSPQTSFFSEEWAAVVPPLPVLSFSEIVRQNQEKKVQPAPSILSAGGGTTRGKEKTVRETTFTRKGTERKNVNLINPDRFPRDHCVLILPLKHTADFDPIDEISRLNLNLYDRKAVQFPTGAVLIMCKSPEEAEYLKQIVAKSESLKVGRNMRIFPRQARIDGIPTGLATKFDIHRCIESTFKEAPRNLRLEPTGNKMVATMEVSSSLLKRMETDPRIEIRGRRFLVDTSIHVHRCEKCQLLGHKGTYCGSAKRQVPKKNEPCLDCTNYNKTTAGVGIDHVGKRNVDHPTGHDKCQTKQYYERKWNRTQKPYDEIDEEDNYGLFEYDDY